MVSKINRLKSAVQTGAGGGEKDSLRARTISVLMPLFVKISREHFVR